MGRSKLNLSLWLLTCVGLLMVGCQTDDTPTPMTSEPDVIVVNEGNFGDADGSFSTFNSATGAVATQAFQEENGTAINALIQNVVEHQGTIFATTNSADKLEIFDASTFISTATISSGLTTPYDFAASGLKGYVSNWGTFNGTTFVYEGGFIAVIDLRDYTITKQIGRAVRPQGLLVASDKLYVANVDGSSVSVFDAVNDEFIIDITVANNPDRMVLDGNDKIWVLCNSGNLVRIDPQTDQVETIITGIQASGFNEKMITNRTRDKLYYLSSTGFDPSTGAVYEFDISATSAPITPLATGNNFYGIGLDPDDNILYVSN
ncbi:MAG: DUF5074 domain-containing protein, partial [Cyclobacteriaceae bacterium]